MSLAIKLKSALWCQTQLDNYYNDVVKRDVARTMMGIALALQTERDTILCFESEKHNYCSELENTPENRMHPNDPMDMRLRDGRLPRVEFEAIKDVIKRARNEARQAVEEKLLGTKNQAVGLICWLKNNASWTDTTTQITINDAKLTDIQQAEATKYGPLIAETIAKAKRAEQSAKVEPLKKAVNA
jgi:hypothetical protein